MAALKCICSRNRLALLTVAAALGTFATPALADRIDGDWCARDGRHITIDGPSIITPGGTKMTGIYDRHHFTYTVPVPETNSGSRIEMTQQSEELMVSRRIPAGGGKPVKLETWKRCEAIS